MGAARTVSLWRSACGYLACALLALGLPIMACAAPDPCASVAGDAAAPRARGRVSIERATAGAMVRHARKACDQLAALRHGASPTTARTLAAIAALVETGIVAPIEREYPDLGPRDVAALPLLKTASAPSGSSPPTPRQMGPATALHLRWVDDVAEQRVAALPSTAFCPTAPSSHPETDLAAARACFRKVSDLLAEIGFAAGPVYINYPNLWRQRMREAAARPTPRSVATLAAFRKAAPPPGSVTLTPAALAEARKVRDALRRDIGPTCQILDFLWSLDTASKGPNDADWTSTGPGLALGSYGCGEVPPDVVRTIDGVRMIFTGDSAGRFAGKRIDWRDGRFVIEAR